MPLLITRGVVNCRRCGGRCRRTWLGPTLDAIPVRGGDAWHGGALTLMAGPAPGPEAAPVTGGAGPVSNGPTP